MRLSSNSYTHFTICYAFLEGRLKHPNVKMPNFNVHWKVYPHQHLPRIRIASIGMTNSHTPHAAAENVVRLPFGRTLDQARAQQTYRFRRRRKRSYRGSPGLVPRQLVPSKACQEADIHRRKCFCGKRVHTISIQDGEPASQPTNLTDRSLATPSRELQYLTDGASCSRPRSRKTAPLDSRQSLMQVPTPYYGDISINGSKRPAALPTTGGRTHVAASPRVRTRSTNRSHRSLEKIHVYDPRLARNESRPRIKRKKSTILRHLPSRHSRQRNTASPKSHGEANTAQAVHKAAQRGLDISVSATNPVTSMFSTILADELVLRSPSRQKALNKFSRGLEKHLIEREALRAASLATTPSYASASAHTIVELMPYIEEFRASGLAVTASDQRPHSLEKGRSLSRTDDLRQEFRHFRKIPGMAMIPDDRLLGDSSRCSTASGTATSCTTIIAFPPLEISPPPTQLEKKISPKKILPWLRKGNNLPCTSDCSARTAISTTTIIDFPTDQDTTEDKGKQRAVGMFMKLLSLTLATMMNLMCNRSASAFAKPRSW